MSRLTNRLWRGDAWSLFEIDDETMSVIPGRYWVRGSRSVFVEQRDVELGDVLIVAESESAASERWLCRAIFRDGDHVRWTGKPPGSYGRGSDVTWTGQIVSVGCGENVVDNVDGATRRVPAALIKIDYPQHGEQSQHPATKDPVIALDKLTLIRRGDAT